MTNWSHQHVAYFNKMWYQKVASKQSPFDAVIQNGAIGASEVVVTSEIYFRKLCVYLVTNKTAFAPLKQRQFIRIPDII